MRSSKATALACAVLLFPTLLVRLVAGDDARDNQPGAVAVEEATNAIRAPDKAVVKDVVYSLEAEENRLFLASQPLDGADRQLKRVEVKFAVPEGAEIVELALAKMDGKNLMAVVKARRAEKIDFYCLTFIGPWGGGHVRDQNGGCHQAKFFTTRDSDVGVLAVSGRRGHVFIVLGKMGLDDDERAAFDSWITEGVFYFSGCPWPPSDGSLSPFRAKSLPHMRAADAD
jgi:hypothetical protein